MTTTKYYDIFKSKSVNNANEEKTNINANVIHLGQKQLLTNCL